MAGDREICEICQQTYSKMSNLLQHMRRVHFGIKTSAKVALLQCEICEKILSSKRSYSEHINTHMNTRPHTCHLCPYAACSQMTLKRHILRKHADKACWSYLCLYCGQRFMEPTRYQSHIKSKHPGCSGTFICDACDFGSLAASVFEDHLGRHERGEILNTDGTPNSFTRRPLINYLMADGVIIDSPYSQLDSISSLSSVDKPQEFSGAKVVVSSKGISPQGRPVVTIERANDISVLKITEEIVTATPSETSVKPVSQNTRLDHIYGSNVEKIPTKRPSKRVVKRSTTNSKAKQRKTDNHRSEDVVISAAIAPSENSMELANLVKDVQELINSSLYPIQPARELLEPELD